MGGPQRKETYECAISEKFHPMFLANVRHAIERAYVDQGKLRPPKIGDRPQGYSGGDTAYGARHVSHIGMEFSCRRMARQE